MRPETKSLVVQARARIIWGDEPETVKHWLLENGVAHDTALLIVEKSMEERRREMRRIGLRNLIRGGAFCLVGLATIGFALRSDGPTGAVLNRVGAAGVGAFLYGLWRVSEGLFRLFFGGSSRESIPDITH